MLILSSNTTEFERITGATTAQINFSTEEIQTEFYPHFNDQLFGALNPITTFLIIQMNSPSASFDTNATVKLLTNMR